MPPTGLGEGKPMNWEICPIFDRCEPGRITLVGAWMMHPMTAETMPNGISSTLGHIGPMLARYFGDEPYREIPNGVIDMGKRCRFVGGVFWMGHDHPAPNESGGRPGIEFEYVIKRNAGTTICVRTRKSSVRSWWLQETARRGSHWLATRAARVPARQAIARVYGGFGSMLLKRSQRAT
jgi:hypothetical protein